MRRGADPAAGRRPVRRGRRDGAGYRRGDPLGKRVADGPVQHAPDGLPLPVRPDPRAGGRPDRRGGDSRRASLPARRLFRPVLPPDARPGAGGVVVTHAPGDFFTDDHVDTRGIDRRLLVRLLRYVLPHGNILAGALAALLCGTACQLAGPYLIKIVIDRHVIPGQLSGMGGWVLLYLAALVGAMGFVYLQMYAVSVLGQRVILALRRDMFTRMQRLPVVFFDRTPTGRLMTRLTSDVEALQELLSSGLVSTIGDAAVLMGTAAILLWMDLRLALVTFAVLPVLVLFVELLKKRIREANREMRRKLARMNAFLQEHVTGVAVVKAFGMEGKSGRGFEALNREYAAESVRLTNLYSVYFPGVEMLASIAVALLLWRGGVGHLSGAVTFGTLVAFLEYARRFYDPIKDMSDKYNILQTALAASERIFRLLDEEISPEYAEVRPDSAPGVPSPPSASGAAT